MRGWLGWRVGTGLREENSTQRSGAVVCRGVAMLYVTTRWIMYHKGHYRQ